jgi:signal transduction histidine kinase
LKISISDTGIGISPQLLPNLFKKFFQAPNEDYSGSGLGLCIAKNIIDLMDGSIDVESTPGKGTSFKITVVLEKPLEEEVIAYNAAHAHD